MRLLETPCSRRYARSPLASYEQGLMTRRKSLAPGAWLAALSGAAASAHARQNPPTLGSADVDENALLLSLLHRTGYGVTPADYQRATTLGYAAYLEEQLNPASIVDTRCDDRLSLLATLNMTVRQFIEQLIEPGRINNELTEAVIVRAVFSKRQLFERMVEFWNDHFNIAFSDAEDRYLRTTHDKNVIRSNTLTTFPQLLNAVAQSAAMILFLNNDTNLLDAPNENYARELMELHTLGVNGGYTQVDVEEVARCFTGWAYYGVYTPNETAGSFRYRPENHDDGEKIVLGNIIPAGGGLQDGLTVLRILAEHPSTARFLSTKLCKWFLGDSPPRRVIDAVAQVYTSTQGDIKAMIRAILQPAVLYDAKPKYKRPQHFYYSAMRTLPLAIISSSGLRNHLISAGHRPFYWPRPDGYPDTFDHWYGLVMPRWNFAFALTGSFSNIFGVTFDLPTFLNGATTADQIIQRIDTELFLGHMPALERSMIRQYLEGNPPSDRQKREAISLAFSMPAYQWF